VVENGIPAKDSDRLRQPTDGVSARADFQKIVRAVRGDGE
jgi:hypothetical protein